MRFAFCCLFFACFLASCSTNNVARDEGLDRLFDNAGLRGSFGLMDNGQGKFTIHSLSRFKDSAYSPGGSFTPVAGLIGLKTGRLNNEHTAYRFDTANATLVQAMQAPNQAWLAGLAQNIGLDTMRRWLDSLSYGRKNIASLNNFWNDGSIALTADEQLGIVKRLYFDQLPFDKRSMRLVRQAMIREQNNLYTLAYHFSRSAGSGQPGLWLLGWIEENKHPYPFVLQLNDKAGWTEAQTVAFAKKLLKQQGLGYGKR